MRNRNRRDTRRPSFHHTTLVSRAVLPSIGVTEEYLHAGDPFREPLNGRLDDRLDSLGNRLAAGDVVI
jgi:hypothetical protein